MYPETLTPGFYELYNKKEHIPYHRANVDNKYNFKRYVLVEHLKNMVNSMQRIKIKDQEEYSWLSFVQQQWKKSNNGERNTKLRNNDITSCNKGIHSIRQRSPDRIIEFHGNDMNEKKRKIKKIQEDPIYKRSIQAYSYIGRNDDRSFVAHRTIDDFSLKIVDEEDLCISDEEKSESKGFLPNGRKENRKCSTEANINTADQFDHFSSSQLNTSYNIDGAELIYTRPNPQATYKILTMLRKIDGILDEISLRLDNIPVPDSDQDLQRRQQRVSEFAIRFSRNYLYNLGRRVAELQRHINTISSTPKIYLNRKSLAVHMRATEQKLIIAHQLLIQALTAYCKSIPNSVLKGHPGKLKDILQIVTALQDICDKMQLNLCYFGAGDNVTSGLVIQGKAVQKKCSSILAKLQLSGNYEMQIVRHRQSDVAPRKKHKNPRDISDRYNMYTDDQGITRYRNKKLGDINKGKKRITVRANVNNPPVPRSYPESSVDDSRKQMSVNGRTKVIRQPREEDIKTVMEVLSADADENNSAEEFGKSTKKIVHCVKLACDVEPLNNAENTRKSAMTKDTVPITNDQLPELLPAIADLMILLKRENDFEVRSISPTSMSRILDLLYAHESPTDRKAPVGENIISHVQSLPRNNLDVMTEGYSAIVHHGRDAACQTYHEFAEGRSENSKRSEEDKTWLTLTNDTKSCIVQYRNEYQRLSNAKPMYTCNTQNKPWKIVSWISDKLVDELIVDVSRELEMDDVIQKLFDFEFQEF